MTATALDVIDLVVRPADPDGSTGGPSGDPSGGPSGTSTGNGSGSAEPILNGVSLTIGAGECHAIMGPNGSGKSTLAATIMGSDDYEIVRGSVRLFGEDVTDWSADERSRAGMFLAFQYPQAISGVSIRNFLRQAVSARKGTEVSVIDTYVTMTEWMNKLEIDESFADRYLNEGFSGGERKRNEVLQLAMLEPEVAVLDETDSGLDIDALKITASGIKAVRAARPQMGVLAITHYQRLLDEIRPDAVHVLADGQIAASGGIELADRLERDGYDDFV